MAQRWLMSLLIVGTVGCGSSQREAPLPVKSPTKAPLRVAAASDLRVALPALVEQFQAARGMEVVPVFGSSGNLAR